jgi:hypothetical protein
MNTEEAAVVRPSPAAAADAVDYLAGLRQQYDSAGLVLVQLEDVGPKVPCCLELGPGLRFQARQEDVHHLQRLLHSKHQSDFYQGLLDHLRSQGRSLKRSPTFCGISIDLFRLHRAVSSWGGFDGCDRERKWREVADTLQVRKLVATA